MPRFAANLSLLFTEHPFPERFGAAARAGFQAVEFQFPYAWPAEQLAAEVRAHSLEVVLFNLPAGRWEAGERGLACLPGRETAFRAGIERALHYAEVLGCPRLNCLAGLAPPDADRATLETTLLANLAHAAEALGQAGRTLLIEPINGVDVPGFFIQRSDEAAALIAALGADNVRLQYDLYHAARMGEDIARTLAARGPQIGHIQIADAPGRHEPGSGQLPFAEFFAQLDALGYAGWIGCEYHPATSTEAGLDWLTTLTGPRP